MPVFCSPICSAAWREASRRLRQTRAATFRKSAHRAQSPEFWARTSSVYPAAAIETVTPIGCFPLFLRLPAVLVIGLWAAIQFVQGFGTIDVRANAGGVAYFAHIGGFSCGALLVGFVNLFRERNPSRSARR